MVRTKTVARKAGGGTVSGGFPTPTQPVLTQDVEAEVARATEAAQHVARLRAMIDGDGSSRALGATASKWRTYSAFGDETSAMCCTYLWTQSMSRVAFEPRAMARAAAHKHMYAPPSTRPLHPPFVHSNRFSQR